MDRFDENPLEIAAYVRQNGLMLSGDGSFLNYWTKRYSGAYVHFDDKCFFNEEQNRLSLLKASLGYEDSLFGPWNFQGPAFKVDAYGAWPYDGPLLQAKVVICYANPFFRAEDIKHAALIQEQRKGTLPLQKPWYDWYRPRIASPMGLGMEQVADKVAVLNVCPYPSEKMDDRATKFAAGLPSVWAAQKYLREVLIEAAKQRKIYLVIARKHSLWGITEGFASDNIAIVRNRQGSIGQQLGLRIRRWLEAGGHLQ